MPLAYAFFLADVNTDVDAVNGVMSSLFQLSAYLLLMPLLVILASNLLFEELDNDTLKNLVTIPINRTKLVLSKMLVLLLFAVGFMAVGGLVNLAVLLFQDVYKRQFHNREFHNVNCRFCGAIHSVNWALISALHNL